MTPPRLPQRLIRLTLGDTEWADAIVGDLDEEFVAMARRDAAIARRWYWRQALAISARMAAGRLIRSTSYRPAARLPVADADRQGRSTWWHDLVAAWRMVSHRPAVSATIVLTLALALAANATIFGLADALYLRPFRFEGVDRLVVLASVPENDPGADPTSVAPADFRDWAREATTLTDFNAAVFWDPNMSGVDDPEQVPGFRVTPAFFRAIRAAPLLGRTFVDDEAVPGRDRVVVIGHGLWRRRFGSDPAVLGKTVRFDGDPHQVVGVMGPGTALPFGAEVWAPLAMSEPEWAERRRGGLLAVARLAHGVALGTARAELAGIVDRQRREHPDTHASRPFSMSTFTRALSDGFAAPFLAIWQAAAVLLLLIACANIANLLLARGAVRQPEFALRLALGASRSRIVRQLLFESTWMALMATVMAIPLATGGIELMRRALPPGVRRWVAGIEFMQLDLATIGVTAALAAGGMLAFSWLPAKRAGDADLAHTLQQGGRTVRTGRLAPWLGTTLAAAQVAVTLALVLGAGLVLGGVNRAINGSLGFDKTRVLTAQLTLPARQYAEPERRRQFIARVSDRLRGIPAVETLAVSASLPYTPTAMRPIYPEGGTTSGAEATMAGYQRVGPAYFDVLRIPLLEGRLFNDGDLAAATPVAIVSRGFADRLWPGQPAVGKRFRTESEGAWVEIVGVSGDVVTDLLLHRDRPVFYRPISQDVPFGFAFAIRTHGDALLLAGELRRAIAAADPDQPVLAMRTLEQVVAERSGGITSLARALGVMGVIALLVALTGIYSLIAYLTARRTREFGVRLALGATPSQLLRLSARRVVVITLSGLGLGAVLGTALAQLMSSTLFGLVTIQPAMVGSLALVVGLTVLVAGIVPARRAAALDPTEALRRE